MGLALELPALYELVEEVGLASSSIVECLVARVDSSPRIVVRGRPRGYDASVGGNGGVVAVRNGHPLRSLRWHPLQFPLREGEGKGCVSQRGELSVQGCWRMSWANVWVLRPSSAPRLVAPNRALGDGRSRVPSLPSSRGRSVGEC